MDRIKVGDYVRVVGLLADRKPVGIVKSIDGGYIYVKVTHDPSTYPYECYDSELQKITEKEYFKLLLSGTNERK